MLSLKTWNLENYHITLAEKFSAEISLHIFLLICGLPWKRHVKSENEWSYMQRCRTQLLISRT